MTPPATDFLPTSLRRTSESRSTLPRVKSTAVVKTKLALVVAASENGVIGCNGALPWKLSTDLKRFRDLTIGNAVIIGRKTFESIGKPLPQRTSIVLSRGPWSYGSEDVVVARSFDEAVEEASRLSGQERQTAYVIGGGEIYRLALPKADRIYLTRVHTTVVEGDATFPELDKDEWRCVSSIYHPADERNEYSCTFEEWERVQEH